MNATLVERLQAGNPFAQQRLWKDCYAEVYAICARILGRGPEATDTTADVLCDFMFKYVHRLSQPEAFRAYLRLMAVRRSLRRRDGRLKTAELKADGLADPQGTSPEEAAEVSVLLPRLEHCLGRLSPKAQQVVRLRFGDDMANQCIGGLVGGSKQYIGRLIRQSLELLRACLEQATA